jgi:hypothetical protein
VPSLQQVFTTKNHRVLLLLLLLLLPRCSVVG